MRMLGALHPGAEHYVAKVQALKKAFFFVNLDAVPGDYAEFGVFQGTSFVAALRAHLVTRSATSPERSFWGFDGFEGLHSTSAADRHPSWTEGEFAASYAETRRRVGRAFRTRARWQLVPGLFQDTIALQTAPARGIERIAVVLIDCDLLEPARLALDFVAPALQEGSVLLFDEFLGYRGSPVRGEAGAFDDFCKRHPELSFRPAFEYGLGGRAFLLAARSSA